MSSPYVETVRWSSKRQQWEVVLVGAWNRVLRIYSDHATETEARQALAKRYA